MGSVTNLLQRSKLSRQQRRRVRRQMGAHVLRQILGRQVSRRIIRIGARAYANASDRIAYDHPMPAWHRYLKVVLNQRVLAWMLQEGQGL